MTEYLSINASITTAEDHLVLVARGMDKFIHGSHPRRIPYAAIASLQFRDAGMNNGFLRLVLGDNAPVEKPGLRSLVDDPDTIVFHIGKQARGIRELVPHLERMIEHYRSAGVDPATVSYDPPPTVVAALERMAETNRLANREALSGVRPDVVAAAEGLSDLSSVREAIEHLPEHLAAGEEVERIVSGGYGSLRGHSALLVLTTSQVLLIQHDRTQQRSDSLPRSAVTGVAFKSGLMGKIEVYGNGRSLTLASPDAATAQNMVASLRALSA